MNNRPDRTQSADSNADRSEQHPPTFPENASLKFQEPHRLLEFLPAPALLFRSSDNVILGTNPQAASLFGFSEVEQELSSFIDLCFDPALRCQLLTQLNQEVSLCDYQVQLKKADGTPLEVSVSLQKLILDETAVVLCILSDLSEHKRVEEALRKSEARFRTLAETTSTIIFIRQGKQFSYINPAAQAITGYKCEELLAYPDIHQLIKERKHVSANQIFFPQLFPQYEEVKILTKSGEDCWLACSIAITEFDGKPAILGTAIDITKRKQAEAEIRKALAKEKELNELRAHFISMVSHEFVSPLNIISLSASSLKRFYHQWSEEKKFTYLSRIQANVEKVSQLLNQLLFIGQIEAEKIEAQPTAIDIGQFCSDLIGDMSLTDNHNHPITFVNHSHESTVYLDKKILHSILTNLISNALKYSPPNSPIRLELWMQEQTISIQIIDQGIGIPQDEQTSLYEVFYRGSNVGDTPGSGLGLTVVKKFIEILHGEITFDSKLGAGTTCTVTLPASKV